MIRTFLISTLVCLIGGLGMVYQLEEGELLLPYITVAKNTTPLRLGQMRTQLAHLRPIRHVDMEERLDQRPVANQYRISSRYGMRRHPVFKRWRMHWGVDFAVPRKTPVRAAAAGIVTELGIRPRASTYGRFVKLGHDDVQSSLYAHLSEVWVEAGQEVAKGDTLGLSGNSGISTSPHLHVEFYRNGSPYNPVKAWK